MNNKNQVPRELVEQFLLSTSSLHGRSDQSKGEHFIMEMWI